MKVVATQRGTKGAAEDQFLVLRRELSQMSLHRVDEHRRRSDDAHASRRLRQASDPPPVSELGELSRDPDPSRIQVQVAASDRHERTHRRPVNAANNTSARNRGATSSDKAITCGIVPTGRANIV
jgi:hypothetical protein